MPLLEEHDELGFPWDDWADGKVHRLIRGKDFARSSEALTEAAENAGRRLGRVARTVTEVRYGRVFFWFQFLDQELYLGDPCRCGSSDLRRVNKIYARCASCGATAYVRPLKTKPEPLPPPVGDEAPLLAALLGGTATAAKGSVKVKRAAAPPDPRADLAQLGAYVDVRLYRYSKDDDTERMAGLATEARAGSPCLVVVDYPLSGGERIEAVGVPGGFAHRVQSLGTKLFAGLLRLDELARREPGLEIDDPLAGMSTTPAGRTGEDAAPALAELRDVTLLGRGETATSERYVGYGSTPAGEHVLLSLRYRLAAGARTPDPRDPDQPRYELRSVPVEPFAQFVELEELLSAPGSFRLEEGGHPTNGSAAIAGERRDRKRKTRQRTPKQGRKRERSGP